MLRGGGGFDSDGGVEIELIPAGIQDFGALVLMGIESGGQPPDFVR